MEREIFEKLVAKAIDDLPEDISRKMRNVAIVVEEIPSAEQMRKTGVRQRGFLLGLYEGFPRTEWGQGFGNQLPDKVTIFQKSIENFAKTPEDMRNLVKTVVWHEIAHHFGINEKKVRKLEQKWNSKL